MATTMVRRPGTLGVAVAALAASALVVLAAAAVPAVALIGADIDPQAGAGPVAWAAALVLAVSVVLTLARPLHGSRLIRVRPMRAALVFYGLTLGSALVLAVVTAAGNAAAAQSALSWTLWMSVGAGALFGVASLPLAD